MMTAEMDGMTALQVVQLERRNRDALGPKVTKAAAKPLEVGRQRQEGRSVSRLNSAAP